MTFTLSPCVVLPTIFSALNFFDSEGGFYKQHSLADIRRMCALAIRSHPFKYCATQRYLKRDVACEEIKKSPGSTDRRGIFTFRVRATCRSSYAFVSLWMPCINTMVTCWIYEATRTLKGMITNTLTKIGFLVRILLTFRENTREVYCII